MKLSNVEVIGITLFILFIMYLYYKHINTSVKTQSVYYPVYKTQYIPVSRPTGYPRPRPLPRPRPRPSHHHSDHHLEPGHVNPTRKYPGGVIPIEPLK
tara:strand:- start:994 stop:1287 length:294 start_codon:yes stop_codon:yes gene_type:complete